MVKAHPTYRYNVERPPPPLSDGWTVTTHPCLYKSVWLRPLTSKSTTNERKSYSKFAEFTTQRRIHTQPVVRLTQNYFHIHIIRNIVIEKRAYTYTYIRSIQR